MMSDPSDPKTSAHVLAERDHAPLFKHWTEDQWRAVAGRVLVIAIDRKQRTRRLVTDVKDRSEFDINQHRSKNPNEMIQFMQIPQPHSLEA